MNQVDFNHLGRVGVLYGGMSAERDVSIASGQAVLESCARMGIDTIAIDIDEQTNVVTRLQQTDIDIAFIALHGGMGEDGRLQSLLDLMGIPYTGSGMQASVLAMHKLIAKQLWQSIDLPTPRFAVIDSNTDLQVVLNDLGGRAIVKPAHEGSSIGMAVVNSVEALQKAYETAKHYDSCVFAEELMTGGEYTVAILNGEVLPPIKLETDHVFYDYDAKYLANDTRYLCPCGLPDEEKQQLMALSQRAFNSLQCYGWGRVDVMRDACGEFSVLEINTVPGMTSHSLVPMSAKAAGYSFDDLVAAIIQGARVIRDASSNKNVAVMDEN